MSEIKLTLNSRHPPAGRGNAGNSDALKAAAQRKQAQNESLEDAWRRILATNITDKDRERLLAVKAAMDAGELGRDPADMRTKKGALKRFSKAEALRLYAVLAEQQREGKLADMVANTPENYVLVDTLDKATKAADDIRNTELIALDCETFGANGAALDPWRGDMAGFSVTTDRYNYYVPLNHTEKAEINRHGDKEIVNVFAAALRGSKIVMHNAPFDCKWFAVKYGLNLADALHADTRIIAMALDENRDHRLKNLLTDWLREPSANFDELFHPAKFDEIPLNVALPYAAGDTEKTLKLYRWMMKHLNTDKLAALKRLLFEIEMPVARRFIHADLRGIRFDSERAAALDAKLAQEEAEHERRIYELLGEEINLNSPAQVSRKFFGDLGLTDHGKGSVNNRFIKKIMNEHEVVRLYAEYKEIGKLRQAFTHKLPQEVKEDGRIHPWHNTYGAATGRFTCSNPNTQQIPAKRPEIRHLFQASGDDRILVSIDYSQIELRVLAHEANETVLIEAFEMQRDIHSTTAALISGYSYEEIEANKDTDGSPQQKFRKQAKVVNFGIVYGMGANKLADTLGLTQKEAQKIIDDYFRGYPGIARYMDEQHRLVRRQGFVTDIFGRKRRLHSEVKSRDKWRVLSAERMAGNFPIQSGAGGILKKAVVDLEPVLPPMDVHILTQTHDEIMFDCPRSISREELNAIRETMENAVKLKCPVRCDVEIYPERWQEKVDEEEFFAKLQSNRG